MTDSRGAASGRAASVTRVLLLAATGAYLALFLGIALLRVAYPFELEWEEGFVWTEVQRLLAGLPLYHEPSLEHLPLPYPPGYYFVSALAARVLGTGFLPLRLVSLAASLVTFALLFRIAKHWTNSRAAGFVAAGCFAATFRLGGAWFDVARVDSLALALLLFGGWLLLSGANALSAVAAGFAVAFALLTKQTMLALAIPLFVIQLIDRETRGRSALAGGVAVVATAGAVFALERSSSGWFGFHVWSLLRGAGLDVSLLGDVGRDLLWMAPALVCSVIAARSMESRHRRAFAALLFGAGAAAVAARLHPGGYDNVLMPLHAIAALGVGCAAGRVVFARGGTAGLVAVAVALQLGLCVYSPTEQLPSAADREAGEHFVELLRELPGEVLAPEHGYLVARVGGQSGFHAMGLIDLLRSGADEPARSFVGELEKALGARRYGAILLREPWDLPSFSASYRPSAACFVDPDVFQPVTGARNRARVVYLPRP